MRTLTKTPRWSAALGALVVLLGGSLAFLSPAVARATEVPDPDTWIPVPLRVRNLAFPTMLVLGFVPRPAEALPEGSWVVEVNGSISNNFQASEGVERYLAERSGPLRPLSLEDVDTMAATLDGEQFLIDGEFLIVDVGVHYAITDRWTSSLRLSHMRSGGAVLDGGIFGFHETFGFDQDGRQHVADHQTQIVLLDDGGSFVHLGSLGQGFLDPVFSTSYVFAQRWKGWRFAIEGGFKLPLASEEELRSTGSGDLGFQLTFDRKWKRNALILNLSEVLPGAFSQSETFRPPDLPSVNLSLLHRFGRRTTAAVQFLLSESIFRDIQQSALTELEIQVAAGVKVDAWGGSFGLGFTENLLHYDNTPDFAVHLSWGTLLK